MESINALIRSHPAIPAYGPVALVTILTIMFKVLGRHIRDKQWQLLHRDYFYLGMPLLWASFGRFLGRLINDARVGETLADSYVWFLLAWLVCAFVVFSLHATYERPEADLLRELKYTWKRRSENRADLGSSLDEDEPTEATAIQHQRLNLCLIAPLMAMATFALYDYFFEQAVFPLGKRSS